MTLAAFALVALAVRTAPASALTTDDCAVSVCDDPGDGGSGAADDGSWEPADSSGDSSFEGSEYGTGTDTGFEGSEYGTGEDSGSAGSYDDYQGYETTDERADHPADPEQSDPLEKYKYAIASDNHIGWKDDEGRADHAMRMLRTGTCWPIFRKEARLHREMKNHRMIRFFHMAEEELDVLVQEYFDAECGTAMQGIIKNNRR